MSQSTSSFILACSNGLPPGSSMPIASESLAKILLPMNETLLDLVARPFVDHEPQREPFVLFVELKLPADLGLEEAERAVVGGQAVDVARRSARGRRSL